MAPPIQHVSRSLKRVIAKSERDSFSSSEFIYLNYDKIHAQCRIIEEQSDGLTCLVHQMTFEGIANASTNQFGMYFFVDV